MPESDRDDFFLFLVIIERLMTTCMVTAATVFIRLYSSFTSFRHSTSFSLWFLSLGKWLYILYAYVFDLCHHIKCIVYYRNRDKCKNLSSCCGNVKRNETT